MAGVSSESLATALAALEAKLPTASLQLAKELFVILGMLASSRWASARDIGYALDTLAATVVISVAENKSAVSASGITGLEELENDLFSFNQTVASSHEVQRALGESQASAAAKISLAEKLLPGASPEA